MRVRVRTNTIRVRTGQSSNCPTITEIDGGTANMTPSAINGILDGGTP